MFAVNPAQRVVFHGEMVTLFFYPNATIIESKFCVVVQKKIHKLATTRNRVRRVIYEVLRSHEAEFDEYFKGNLVFSVKKSLKPFSSSSLVKDVEHIVLQRKK